MKRRLVCFAFGLAQALPGVTGLASAAGLTDLMPPIPPPPARPGATASAAPGAPAPVSKAILSGPVTLSAVAEEGGVQRIRVQPTRVFKPTERADVLAAARAVQRDLSTGCGRLCKPGRMPAPVLGADGKLAFDMAVVGLDRQVTATDMLMLMEGRPLPKTVPGQAAAPAADAKP